MHPRTVLLAALFAIGCASREVDVELAPQGRTFTSDERRAIEQIAEGASRDVRKVLPALPKHWKLVVTTGKNVIPETGENGTTVQPAEVVWTVDPDRDVSSVIRSELRPTLFHELHHLVRGGTVPTRSLLDAVVSEGLATAFERDFAKAHPPWGDAPPEVLAWTHEILAQPEDTPWDHWLVRHPDGRRWVGMRVGTFVVDRVAKATGRSAADLVTTPTNEIVLLAQVR
jgi:uncharacterized protein YjaZ